MPTITFIGPDGEQKIEAKAGETLLEIAEDHHVKMGSACGGVCACSSCHCYVRVGLRTLPEMEEAEEDRLDMGFDVRPYSRLGCQVKVGAHDLTVELTQETVQTWFNEHPDERKQQDE
ncbi:MAG: 2Fe-2S iron-sulfur cluster binding domain-containing protein [Myxococcales bacterium]|nr:2Fe-2S iron-sulfur cluster binding domain-containing protein [Myxococcales bacterium]